MAYKHGAYGLFDKSIAKSALQASTTVFAVGTLPINNVDDWENKDLINRPITVKNLAEAKAKLGYSEDADWAKFTLCEVIDFFFNNPLTPAAPLTLVNVYDPKKASESEDYEVTEEDIIGTYDASAGAYTGLHAIERVYPELAVVPNIVIVPKWSESSNVSAAIASVVQKINGHFYAFGLVDLPLSVQTIDDAVQYKEAKGLESEFCKGYYPQWKVSSTGNVYHLSTVAAWRMLLNDDDNNGLPMRTDSNCQIPKGTQYFGEDSTNKGFDQQTANDLNAAGISTAVNWAGRSVLWGGHTLAYKYGTDQDARSIFDTNIRLMINAINWFQLTFSSKIDEGLTRGLRDSIIIEYQAKLDAWKSMGAFVGVAEITFNAEENSDADMMNGDFVWNTKLTPTPQMKSATNKVSYTYEGLSSLVE